MPDDYHPQSTDSMFSTILNKLENIAQKQEEHHTEFIEKTKTYDKEIDDLKRFKWMTLGVVACIEFIHQVVEHAKK